MQCRRLFGVFTLTLTHFLAKTIFPEGMGVYIKRVEITEGWGGGCFCVQKMEIPGRREGTCVNSLRGGGMVYFLELHNIAGVYCLKSRTVW